MINKKGVCGIRYRSLNQSVNQSITQPTIKSINQAINYEYLRNALHTITTVHICFHVQTFPAYYNKHYLSTMQLKILSYLHNMQIKTIITKRANILKIL